MGNQETVSSTDDLEKFEESSKDLKELNFNDLLHKSNDAKDYMNMCTITESVKKEPKDFDEFEKAEWLAAFWTWIEAGKPKPTLPTQETKKVIIPAQFYRMNDRNEDKMFYIDHLGGWHGRVEKAKYADQLHPVTGEVMHSNLKVGKTLSYTTKFNLEKFKELNVTAIKLSPPDFRTRYYVQIRNALHSVTAKEFCTKDFEDLIEKYTPGYIRA